MSRRPALLALLALLSIAAAPAARADVRLHPLFQDHMVLQRDAEVAIWGEADPGEAVTVRGSWSPARADATADAEGRWSVRLPTGAAGGPYALTVEGNDTVRLDDVLLGDVWLCSGQSNMEMAFRWHAGVDDHERELAAAYRPRIRLFDVARRASPAPVREVEGRWSVCSPKSVEEFSATAYFFARAIQERVGVPIGLIGSNWGGTRCEAWTSRGALEAEFPEFEAALERARVIAEHPERVRAEAEARAAAWWERLVAADGGVRRAGVEHDDADWGTANLPGAWEGSPVGDFDGVVWYRREVELPSGWDGAPLSISLGPIDDLDTAWWNGVRIGGHEAPGAWTTPRTYAVPAGLARAGRNVVAVRVVDTGGAGGFCGEPAAMSVRHGDPSVSAAFDLSGRWRFERGPTARDLGRFPSGDGFHQNWPTALHNGMIAPLVPFGLKGVIWYQGESNRLEARLYRRLFPAMIRDWRRAFERDELPFLFVQIAPFAYGGDAGQAAELREAQLLALATPHTGMACTMDVGDPKDIHPGNKRAVGRRLARWALAKTYGVDVPYSGPLYRGYRAEGDALRLVFDHGEGLRTRDGAPPSHFVVAGADGVFHEATATIDGEAVVVRSSSVPKPVAARYAWGAADEPNLENAAGLPASSFRTDDPDAEGGGS